MNKFPYAWRVAILFLLVMSAFGGLAARLSFLHVVEHEDIDKRIERTRRLERPITAGRGQILDRHGAVLAIDLPAYDVWIDPSAIGESGRTVEFAVALSDVLDIPVDSLFERIASSTRRGVRIQRFADPSVAERISELGFRRNKVWTRPVRIRRYPQAEMLCHTLGFINWEGQPAGGVEQQHHEKLQGHDGLIVGRRDGRQRLLPNSGEMTVEPLYGSNVKLTIDQNLQAMVEHALDELMSENNAEAAWAIMQNVRTGEILAIASRPGFDLNDFRYSSAEERRNRAITHVYEPGSTFKPLVVAAAIDAGVVAPDDLIDCENGRWYYMGRPLNDTQAHSELSVRDIIKKSSNIGCAKIALEMGNEMIEEYLRKFGIGSRTLVGLPGEEAGILHGRRSWSGLSPTRIAMGYEVAVTALQLLNANSAVVNGGYLMRPRIIDEIRDAQGEVVYKSQPEVITRVISGETSRRMREMLHAATDDEGTGRRARIDGYRVGGKTGTALKAIPGGYARNQHMSSFFGFVPADRPEIAIIVVADNPKPQFYGGAVAAPAFSAVAGEAVRYLRIPPCGGTQYAELRIQEQNAERRLQR